MTRKNFSARLRGLRTKKGLSQKRLAEKVGVIMQSIGHYETRQAVPSFNILVNLAEELGCSLDYLVGRDDKAPAPEHSKWVADLIPELEALDKNGRAAVTALVKALKKG